MVEGFKIRVLSGFVAGFSVCSCHKRRRSSHNQTVRKCHYSNNNIVNESKLYTDLWLSGTKEEPKRHKIAFDIYGGGVDGTEWCTTVEKTFIINGDMYEDAYTTSTY